MARTHKQSPAQYAPSEAKAERRRITAEREHLAGLRRRCRNGRHIASLLTGPALEMEFCRAALVCEERRR